MVKQCDLSVYQGDDWAALVTVLNLDGSVPDLTGYTAQAQIRTGPADEVATVTAEMLTAVIVPNQVSISLTHAQTTPLDDAIVYYWDMQLTSSGGIITTVLAGGVTVIAEVTREAVA